MMMGLLLVAAALFLSVYNMWGEYHAARSADRALEQIEAVLPREQEAQEGQQALTAQENGIKGETSDDAADEEAEMTVKYIAGQEYIGVVEIPSLSLKLPVISQWNEERLKLSPCRYTGSVYTNDLIISGHSYKHHFRYIRNLTPGDSVIFTDMEGKQFFYEVCTTEIIPTNGVEQMAEGDWDLTLFTCTYNGSSRHTVRCHLIQEENSQFKRQS